MAGEVVKACSTCKYREVGGRGCTRTAKPRVCLGTGIEMEYNLWELRQVRKDSGEHASYYEVDITRPTSGGAAYKAECQDIIEALKMDFNEGNAFKALWRRAAARLGNVKKGNEDPLYDAQKIKFYGTRILEQEENKCKTRT